MEVRDAIERRRSVRKFDTTRQIGDDELRRIIEAGRLAPSWKNDQPWRFVVVRSQEQKDRLAEALMPGNPAATAVRTASAVILLIGVPEEGAFHQGKDYWLVDCGIAGQQIFLQATELGIGTVWVSALDGDQACGVAGVPEGMQCVGLFPLGYPLGETQSRPRVGRRPFSEVVFLERYGTPFPSE